jgi:hypothetical protein
MIARDGKVLWSSNGNLEPLPPATTPAPGSVEERIAAHYKAQHEARIAKGLNGELLRDTQGNATRINLDYFGWYIEIDYAPSADLPLPWPHRIRIFHNSSEDEPGSPSSEITIYSVRTSDQPPVDSVFEPWQYLKEGTYVRGKVLPNGHFTAADPKDQRLLHSLRELKRLFPFGSGAGR